MTIQHLEDVQNRLDTRNLPIQRVGVKKLNYPMIFNDDGFVHQTHGEFDLAVLLPAQQKGAHLSRFTSLLHNYHERDSLVMSLELMPLWHKRMLTLLEAEEGSFQCSFNFFIEKKAPVSQQGSLLNYRMNLCCEGALIHPITTLTLEVMATSLCPCSKEISEYGAHNQRSLIIVKAQTHEHFKIKSLIELIEQESSCEIFNLLKRVDEKYVTEKAYKNPKFSEDIVRDVLLSLKKNMPFLHHLSISSEHLESIHTHNAYALIHEHS
jgi:GTP cyclohydrolase I